jgi:hypothetical protein
MKTLLAVLFLLVPVVAQAATPVGTTTLAAGERLYDTSGRSVSNGGANSGSVQVKFDGKLKTDGQGRTYVDGDITTVTNPSSGGSNGPIEITTSGKPLEINLARNGANGPITSNISGGNATITISGDQNDATVGGTGNTLLISGRNSTGTGTAGSGGSVTLTGNGSTFQSGGGNWTFRR